MNNTNRNNTLGFTMVELMISVAILVVVCVLGMVALQSSASALAMAASKSEVQGNLRDVLTGIKRELELASKTPDDSLLPPLDAVRITNNPAANCPVEIVFQTPVDGTGLRWSTPIRLRYFDEDTDNDGVLDTSEDLNGDRTLTRGLLRIQDRNGDGDTADAGESAPVAGANNVSDVQFVQNGDVITVTVASEKYVGSHRDHPIRMTVSSDIYLQN